MTLLVVSLSKPTQVTVEIEKNCFQDTDKQLAVKVLTTVY